MSKASNAAKKIGRPKRVPVFVFRQSMGGPMRGGASLFLPEGSKPGSWMHSAVPMALLTWDAVALTLGPVLYKAEYKGKLGESKGRILTKTARLIHRVGGWNWTTQEEFMGQVAAKVKKLLPDWDERFDTEGDPVVEANDVIAWAIGQLEGRVRAQFIHWLAKTLGEIAKPDKAALPLDGAIARRLHDHGRPAGRCGWCGEYEVCLQNCRERAIRRCASVDNLDLEDALRANLTEYPCETCGAKPHAPCADAKCAGNDFGGQVLPATTRSMTPDPTAPARRTARSIGGNIPRDLLLRVQPLEEGAVF